MKPIRTVTKYAVSNFILSTLHYSPNRDNFICTYQDFNMCSSIITCTYVIT